VCQSGVDSLLKLSSTSHNIPAAVKVNKPNAIWVDSNTKLAMFWLAQCKQAPPFYATTVQ
jgi:hypothetical protein